MTTEKEKEAIQTSTVEGEEEIPRTTVCGTENIQKVIELIGTRVWTLPLLIIFAQRAKEIPPRNFLRAITPNETTRDIPPRRTIGPKKGTSKLLVAPL